MYRCILLLILPLMMGCDFIFDPGPDNANSPEQVFCYIITKPIPQSVSHIECSGDSWQGYRFFMRFKAEDEFIAFLLSQGYEHVEWNQISFRFQLPNKKYDRFDPPWDPEKVQKKECYQKDNVYNQWTGSGAHYLVIDRRTNTVYFYGIGA